jgi:hypothetical protein
MKPPGVHGSWRRHLWPLLLGVALKGAFFIWNHHESAGSQRMGRWAVWDSDMWEYVDTAESFLRGDGWDPDHRMPGYAVVYLLFRSFLDQGTACDALTLFQLLVAIVATYALALGVSRSSGRAALFWPLYLLLLLSSFHALVEIVMINESLAGSALIFHWTTYARYRRTGGPGWIVASGLFLTIAVFMRPVLGPLLVVVPLLELLRTTAPIRKRFAVILLFGLPFAFFDGIWTVRNYVRYEEFHPLTNHGSYNPIFASGPYYSLIYWVQAYGGHCYYWDPIADIRWYGFEPDAGAGTNKPIPGVPEPPDNVYTSQCTRDSLVALADQMRRARQPGVPLAEREAIARAMMASARRFRDAYARERPFQYHVLSRLRLLKHETIHSGSNTLFHRPFAQLGPVEKAYKGLQSLIYWWALVVGMVGASVLVFRIRHGPEAGLLGIIAIYGVLACPFIMRMAEIRYIVPVFPLLVAASLWFVSDLWSRYSSRRREPTQLS